MSGPSVRSVGDAERKGLYSREAFSCEASRPPHPKACYMMSGLCAFQKLAML